MRWGRWCKQAQYRRLQARQNTLVAEHHPCVGLPEALPRGLPGFPRRLAVVLHLVPDASLETLSTAVLRRRRVKRSFALTHKQGGTVAYEALHEVAPEIVAFYQSDYLRRPCSAAIGTLVVPTPLHDPSSCSLLDYEKSGGHMGWHYDHNFYNGRHFTVLLSLVNRHLKAERPSSAELSVRQDDGDRLVPTPPNCLAVVVGARVLHKVTRLG